MKQVLMVVMLSLVWSGTAMAGWFSPDIEPASLRCEYHESPLGIDTTQPRLAWLIADSRLSNADLNSRKSTFENHQSQIPRGLRQTAYQVLVASSEALLKKNKGDLWDSGKVESDQTIQVEYGGKPLVSGMQCWWKVKVWTVSLSGDRNPEPSSWSKSASWTMGLLKPEDWQAKWVKPQDRTTSPWLRKEFTLDAVPERATAYVNVKGYCDLFVNGVKVSEDVLSPAVTEYRQRTRYNTYDITKNLRPGRNCIGAWMGIGLWYRRGESNPDPVPLARIQLDMTVKGKPVVVGTDASWSWLASTHTEHWWDWNQNGREEIDMRCDVPGWSEAGGTQGDWKPVVEHPERTGVATAQSCPPNRITKVFPLVKCTVLSTNLVELDFGTNLNGWLKLRLPQLKSGDKITMHFADKRFQTPGGDNTPIGHVGVFEPSIKRFTATTGKVAYQTMTQRAEYISAGKAGEEYCARFNYFSFRYVIIEGLPTPPKSEDAQALMIESDLKPVGSFECSNELLNRIFEVNLWTIRCLNFGGYMVDCPHRERMGYGADAQTSIDSQIMNLDAAAFYAKWVTDWLDIQNRETGKTGNFAPINDDPACWFLWGGMIDVLPWKTYLYYGDRRLLEKSYDQMALYLEKYVDGFYPGGGIERKGGETGSDWVTPVSGMSPPPGTELLANCYRVYLLDLLAKSADALGKTDDAKRYRVRINSLRGLIHARYYKENEQLYDSGRQLDQAMPLLLGIVPDDLRGNLGKKLEEIILVKSKGHLDTGMLGTYFLFESLRQMGRNDLAYTMATQTNYPGWGYLLSQGATTFGEEWNGHWSQIHACFLNPGGWMSQGLAGILPDETAPAFKKIVIRPGPVNELKWVRCSYDSLHGRIISNWKKNGDEVTMGVLIPPNTTATIFVPARDATAVSESGKPAARAVGVKFLRMEAGAAVYEVGSGLYRFSYPENAN